MTSHRFPPPWHVEQIPGGFKVLDANGQALVYVYARETREQADIAKVLTFDEARPRGPEAVGSVGLASGCQHEGRAAPALQRSLQVTM